MNKEKMLKVGFDSTISDKVLEEAWTSLLKFFETEEALNKKLDEVIKREVKH